LRTLYFVERFWPLIGGVEVSSARLVPLLAQRGHDILVVTDREESWLPERDLYGQVPVRRLPFARAIRERDLETLAVARRTMSDIVREHRPELIHATFTGAGVWVLPTREAPPMILSFHGSWGIDFGSVDGLFSRVVNRAAWVTACSEDALADLLATAPQLAGRSSVILNGLDTADEHEPSEPPAGPPVLLCSGRVVEDKGMDVAIDAFAQIVRERPDARLLIAGDGPELDALIQRAASLGLSDSVQFLGWVSPATIHELVESSSIVLVPSRLEGFGLVALEAALMARPVIATNVGGLPEAIENGTTGVLVPPDDVGATVAAIRQLLGDPETARAMGWAGRSRALQQFSARRHVDEWDALYRRIGATEMSAVS
jgi:glycosyltransferase involved in cell wall biosynthesis